MVFYLSVTQASSEKADMEVIRRQGTNPIDRTSGGT